MMKRIKLQRIKLNTFWSTVLTLVVVYLLLRFGVGYLSMIVTGAERPQPVPGTLMAMYMGLALLAVVVQLAISDQAVQEFTQPIVNLLRGPATIETRDDRIFQGVRWVILAAFPLLVGWIVYSQTAPRVGSPVTGRIQHPTLPEAYEALSNPFRDLPPDEQQVVIE